MTPRSIPRPTHHLVLSDGVTQIGLILAGKGANGLPGPDPRSIRQQSMPKTVLQMTTGDPDYGSYQLPYTNLVQKDWSGGRGWDEFSKDSTRFFDDDSVNSVLGDIILGPKPYATTGWEATFLEQGAPANDQTENQILGSSFVATFPTITKVEVLASMWLVMAGFPAVGKTYWPGVKIYTDVAGHPGVLVASGYATERPGSPPYVSEVTIEGIPFYRMAIPLFATLTVGATYWMVPTAIDDQHVHIAYNNASPGKAIKNLAGDIIYADSQFYYKIFANKGPTKFHFFEYAGTVFAAAAYSSNEAPRLFYNGIIGNAVSNAGDLSKLKTTLSLAGKNLTGCIAKLVTGPGSEEETNWRVIVSNTTTGANDTITVSPNWNIEHTVATQFAIQGTNFWTEIPAGTHTMTKPITDVLTTENFVIFCLGDSNNAKAARFATGAWTFGDMTNVIQCTFMKMIPDSTGKRKYWAARASASTVQSAEVQPWGTPVTWSAAITCGNTTTKITGLVPYGNPTIPFVLKEDSFGSINNDLYAQIPLAEMASVRSEDNGRTSTTFGVYLFFSLLDGFERYYDNRLDDLGPNRDEGLPATRRGVVSKAIPYPGGIIACVDAGLQGYSTILYWNQLGWHELHRGAQGCRILSIHVQVIPGATCDRLWYGEGDQIYWMPMAMNPRKQADYTYVAAGTLITSWFRTNFAEVTKFWKSLTLHTENLASGHKTIVAYYQVDNEDETDTWHELSACFYTSPVQEVLLNAGYTVTGKRIRFKLKLETDDSAVTPRIKALTINAITRVPPAKAWSLTFMLGTGLHDLQGKVAEMTEVEMLAKLEEWADSSRRAAPLWMYPAAQEGYKRVFIDPPAIMPNQATAEQNTKIRIGQTLTMSIYEV